MTLGLGRRIAFTVGALVVYVVGTHAPVPGIQLTAWAQWIGQPLTSYLGPLP
jgi:preprotein translocase subunit SecY